MANIITFDNNVIRDDIEIEVEDIRVGYDGTTYASAGDAVREKSRDIKLVNDQLVDSGSGFSVYDFELGNMSFSTSGWSYGASNKRVRTKEGTVINLKYGDVIGLKDYSHARFAVGFKFYKESTQSYAYSYQNLGTTDFVVPIDGEYTILIAHLDGEETSALSSIHELLDLLFIDRVTIADNAYKIATSTNVNTAYNRVGFDVNDFDIGNISISGSGWAYSDNNTRVRTKEGTTIRLCKGDVISLTDYTNAQLYIGWISDVSGAYSYKGWITEGSYTLLVDGEYVLLFAPKSGSQRAHSVFDYLDLLRIERPTNTAVKSIYDLPFWDNGKMRIHAHAGIGNQSTPVNSIPAFINACVKKAFLCETDIRKTSDGELVCIHDATVDRTTDGSGTVSNMTLAQIRELHLLLPDETVSDLQVPTIDEFLLTCKKYNVIAAMELKAPSADTINRIVEKLSLYGMESQSMFLTTYIDAGLKLVRTITNIPCLLITNNSTWSQSFAQARTYDYVGITYDTSGDNTVSQEKIAQCHAYRVPLDVFTISSKSVADSYFDMGVDMVTTDYLTESDWIN